MSPCVSVRDKDVALIAFEIINIKSIFGNIDYVSILVIWLYWHFFKDSLIILFYLFIFFNLFMR